jgi:transcriptional regulator of acetoin/glycerol metabolism
LINQNIELEEAVQRLSRLETADRLVSSEIKFTISREKYDQLHLAMQNSKYAVRLVFDKSGVLIRAEPDV